MNSNSTLSLIETDLLRAFSNLLCRDEVTAKALSMMSILIKDTKMQHDFEFILNEIKNQDFIYSPTSVLEIINKIHDPEIKTFMQTTWDNYHGANKIS